MLNMTEMFHGFVLCGTDCDKTVLMMLGELFTNEVLDEMGFSDKWKITLIDSTCSWNCRCHGLLFCEVVSEVKKNNIMLHFFVVGSFRLRRKKTSVRKYGVLASREDVELTPLGAEDEDEDMALFDMTAVKSRPW